MQAGLLTCPPFAAFPMPTGISGVSANVLTERELTAAGLSRILTGFPFQQPFGLQPCTIRRPSYHELRTKVLLFPDICK